MNEYDQLLQQLQAAQSDEERAWLTLQFNLSGEPDSVRAAVWAAAIPQWFDRAFLEALLPLSDSDFQRLLDLPYVEVFPERGWNVHERKCELLRKRLWEEDRARYRALSRRAAVFCRSHDQADPVWRAEALYHAVMADEPRGGDTLIDQGLEWHNSFRFTELGMLIRPLLTVVQAGWLTGRVAAWVLWFRARLDYYYFNLREAKQALLQALAITADDELVKANCLWALGDVHVLLSELSEARTRYEEALPLCRAIGSRLGEANCIHALGDVHASLSEWVEARSRYEEAFAFYRSIEDRLGEANCIHALGDIHVWLSEWNKALVRYEEALSLYRTIKNRRGEANCIRSLGSLATGIGELETALEYFTDAARQFRTLGVAMDESSCYNDEGSLYQNTQQYQKAIAAYSKAITCFPHVLHYTYRAEAYIQLDDYAAAQRDLDAAAELNPDYDYLHFNRGRLALWQQQPQAALTWFDQACEKRPAYGEFHLWRALAQALTGAPADEELQAGLERTYLARQVAEAQGAAEKLMAMYRAEAQLGPLLAQLKAYVPPSEQDVQDETGLTVPPRAS